MKIIEEPWVDFNGSETVALSLEKDEQYTISEFIELLKSAQEKFNPCIAKTRGIFKYCELKYSIKCTTIGKR